IRWGWDPFLAPKIGKILDSIKTPPMILLVPLFMGGVMFYVFVNVHVMVGLLISLLFFQFLSTIFVTTTDTLAASAASQTDQVK
ncbi:MFS transporter, partial [Planococcus sp. SIMBA_143]